MEKQNFCEQCLHYRACLLNSEYAPSRCSCYEDKAGYRKASDIAREIFEKVERAFGGAHMLWYHTRPVEYEEYEKIKKKYIGEDTNVHTNTGGENENTKQR